MGGKCDEENMIIYLEETSQKNQGGELTVIWKYRVGCLLRSRNKFRAWLIRIVECRIWKEIKTYTILIAQSTIETS